MVDALIKVPYYIVQQQQKLVTDVKKPHLLNWKSALFFIFIQLHLNWWQHDNLFAKTRKKNNQHEYYDTLAYNYNCEHFSFVQFNLPDSMERIQFESLDGMVNAGIAMLQLRLHWRVHQTWIETQKMLNLLHHGTNEKKKRKK